MQGSDALTAVAEISLGLAGFTGIVLAFFFRAEGRTAFDALRALFLLLTGFGALGLSLLPLAFHFAGVSEPNVWRGSSFAMVLYFLTFVWAARAFSGLEWDKVPNSGVLLWVSWAGGLSNVLLQLCNLWFGTLALFFFGLLWYLAYGCLQFAAIIYFRPRS